MEAGVVAMMDVNDEVNMVICVLASTVNMFIP